MSTHIFSPVNGKTAGEILSGEIEGAAIMLLPPPPPGLVLCFDLQLTEVALGFKKLRESNMLLACND